MNIKVYPRAHLEALWKEDKSFFTSEASSPPLCLRCGRPLHPRLIRNPLSRYADIHICTGCGYDEAGRDISGSPLPFSQWHAAKEDLSNICIDPYDVSLKTECFFASVYEKTKQIPLSSTPHPVSEIAYSRSDYDGSKWWTTWFDCQEEKAEWEIAQEIDGFHTAFFSLSDMRNLSAMGKFCTFAEPTNCPTEFNFYSETERLYIWIRMITRSKDYNVYIHYYRKEQ